MKVNVSTKSKYMIKGCENVDITKCNHHMVGSFQTFSSICNFKFSMNLYKPLHFHIRLSSQCEETKSDYNQNHHERSKIISLRKCTMVIMLVNNTSSFNVPRKNIACTKKVNLFM
jgi:hypothetical protein